MRSLATTAAALCGVLVAGGCGLGAREFDPGGPEATSARTRAHSDTRALLRQAATDRPTLARAGVDGCVTGRSDATRRDAWAHSCSVADSRLVVLAAGEDEVAPTLTAYAAVLEGLDCRPRDGQGLDAMGEEYWTPDNPQVAARGAAGLPSVTYDCPDAVALTVQPTSARVADVGGPVDPVDPVDPVGPVRTSTVLGPPVTFDRLLEGGPFGEAALIRLGESGAALAVVLTGTRAYYRTSW